jgi:hypothetical protein
LEYCDTSDLIKREQYYIDNLNPFPVGPFRSHRDRPGGTEYNILKVARSSFGFKHSEATKEILREKSSGKLYSESTLSKISLNNAQSKSITIKDISIGVITEFPYSKVGPLGPALGSVPLGLVFLKLQSIWVSLLSIFSII